MADPLGPPQLVDEWIIDGPSMGHIMDYWAVESRIKRGGDGVVTRQWRGGEVAGWR